MSLGIRVDEIREYTEEGLENLVRELKGEVLTLVHDSGSGHCGGSMSMMKALVSYFRTVHDDYRPNLHLSKGHCVPALYAIGHRFGNITDEEMARFRTIEGLSGHADKRVQAVPSGILGQGAGVVNGMALGEDLNIDNKIVYAFLGDGEMDEPAVWGAIKAAGESGLNVCYVIDYNNKNLTGELVGDFDTRLEAMTYFGFDVNEIENTFEELENVYRRAESYEGPVAMVVDTVKGEGVSFMEEDPSGWHGNPLSDEQYQQAMQELGLEPFTFRTKEANRYIEVVRDQRVEGAVARLREQGFGLGKIPTRKANEYLAELGEKEDQLFVLIPDIGKSVVVDTFARKFPRRFRDVGIDEGGAVLEAMGLAVSGYKPIVSTFDGFNYVFFQAVRMADYGELPFLGFNLTHAEFIGEDGPSHLITENLGAWLGLYNIKTISNAADFSQAVQAIDYSVEQGGLFYNRLGRPAVPEIYGKRELPEPGKADVLMRGDKKSPLFITTGQEVWESLVAAEMLREDGYSSTVVNVAYFKPFDEETVCKLSAGKLVVIPEAHNPNVGLNSLVANSLVRTGTQARKVVQMGVKGYVPSGSIEAQKEYCGLLGEQIYERVKGEIFKDMQMRNMGR